MAHILTDENFDAEVLQSDLPVLVDFWAPWCGPCQMMGPIIEQLATEYEGKVKVGKIDVQDYTEQAQTYGVMGIPAFKIFKNGEVVEEIVGAVPADKIRTALDKHIAA
ncbi:MAG: thioredoxin [Candidatus Peregrinibacteria bacterium]